MHPHADAALPLTRRADAAATARPIWLRVLRPAHLAVLALVVLAVTAAERPLAGPGEVSRDPGEGSPRAPAVDAGRTLAERVDGHRPLRSNPPSGQAPVDPPASFLGYPDVPDFAVVPRSTELNYYPCENCHAVMPVNAQRRQLRSPHPATLWRGHRLSRYSAPG